MSVVASTALSMNLNAPLAGSASASCGVAMTGSVPCVIARLMVGRCIAGTANVTFTGWIWAIVISSVEFAVTRLPLLTARLPVRPSMGEWITV